MTLLELTKVINHNNYKIALKDIYDISAFLEKIGEAVSTNNGKFDTTAIMYAVEKSSVLNKTGEYTFIAIDNEIFNLIRNMKVLEITEDFVIVIGYERFHN